MKKLSAIFIMFVLLGLTGCAAFYGFKQVKPRSDQTIREYANRYKIPSGESFLLDTAFLTFARTFDTTQKEVIKNYLQPLQAFYFDKQGSLLSYHVNCYVSGFPNLKWNGQGHFDTFPPEKQAPTANLLHFRELLQFIKNFDNKAVDPSGYAKADYNVVVFWSVFSGRQSKRFIRLIKRNGELAKGKTLNFLFVNNDYLFAGEFESK
ncbi:MAG: hypothetical protein L3J66_02320 [Bacteroidales bacterium]|nr:hypothetical protein [Bacteroidales bacterium]